MVIAFTGIELVDPEGKQRFKVRITGDLDRTTQLAFDAYQFQGVPGEPFPLGWRKIIEQYYQLQLTLEADFIDSAGIGSLLKLRLQALSCKKGDALTLETSSRIEAILYRSGVGPLFPIKILD